jgi:hypothetical protein
MPYWFLLAFPLGWVFGLAIMKTVRVVADNDLIGILAECVSAWYNAHRGAHPLPSTKTLGTAAGTGICGFGAIAVWLLFGSSRYVTLLPFGFILIVVACSRYFGPMAGTLGSITAAAVFAHFYSPEGFAVSDNLARTSIALMVVTGSAFSWFLAASREH